MILIFEYIDYFVGRASIALMNRKDTRETLVFSNFLSYIAQKNRRAIIGYEDKIKGNF